MAQPAKHTPGPWQISAIQNEPEKMSIIDADMCFVAEVWQTYIDGESRQQAHATLIAAAPAMYEALETVPLPKHNEAVGEFYTRFYAWYEGQRKQALAQAEGRQA